MGISARIFPLLRAPLGSIYSVKSQLPSVTSHLNPTRVKTLSFRLWFGNCQPVMQYHALRPGSKFMSQTNFIYNLRSSGRRLCTSNFLGLSVAAATICLWPTDAHAMEETDDFIEGHSFDTGDSYGHLKEDLNILWELVKKFQIPGILLLMVYLGWRHPLILLIKLLLLLSCTRPSPYSAYIFIEQLQNRAMRQNPGLLKLKLYYVRKIDIQDYKLLCLVNVELRDRRLTLVGILGNWWIVQSVAI